MENEIKVSVICLAYNHAKYIRKCLDGFVMQKTNFKYEVLVHDDASTDDTAKIIKEYELKYPDIIKPIYQTENQYSKGVKITQHILVPRTKGKYIAFCEGDDYWCDENKLQTQVDSMDANPDCKMSVHKVLIINEEGVSINTTMPAFELQTGSIAGEKLIEKTLNTSFQTSSYMMVGKELREMMAHLPRFYQIAPVGDKCMMLYFETIGNIYYIDSIFSCYRKGSIGSWSSRTSQPEAIAKHSKRMIDTLEEFNKYTNYSHKVVQQEINKIKIRVYCIEKNYKAVLAKELRKEFSQMNRKEKTLIYLCAKVPRLMKILKKI